MSDELLDFQFIELVDFSTLGLGWYLQTLTDTLEFFESFLNFLDLLGRLICNLSWLKEQVIVIQIMIIFSQKVVNNPVLGYSFNCILSGR